MEEKPNPKEREKEKTLVRGPISLSLSLQHHFISKRDCMLLIRLLKEILIHYASYIASGETTYDGGFKE